MPQPAFIHLRLHSEYSIADGITRIPDAVEKAKKDGMPALALTDLSNVFGLVKFYQAARNSGLKPIVGCDVFISNTADRDKPSRLLLLCQSHQGYLQLCDLLTRAYIENQYHGRAEINKDWFKAGTCGLIALSGAQWGDAGTALLNKNPSAARQLATEWAGLFPGRFYLEIQRTGFAKEEALIRETVRLAAEIALPVVATHPIQFLTLDDFKAHETRVCIAEGYVLNDKRRARNFTAQQYFKTQAEMAALFADLPEALQNSVEIAKRCNLTLPLGKPHLPNFPTPNNESLEEFLRLEAERGLAIRMQQLFPDEAVRAAKLEEYGTRLAFEIETIIKMGFPGYFLIVADFIRWAKNNGVPVGPGRGSGAGSLVAYSLGITDLDPLRYELLFERFLNPERVSMPDFDVDFCQDGRERVIEYVRQKYGAASVSQIATFGTMASKAVIRDVGRVLDFPYGLCDRLSKLVPLEGVKPVSLKKARELEPEFNAIIETEEGVEELLELGERLEDLTRNVGMHAGGVLIAPGKLTDFCPLYCAEGSDSTVSQLDKDDVELAGLVKFDFLGLRTLTIIDWAVKYVRGMKAEDRNFDIANIALDDKETFERIFKNANTTAVFQFESRGMKDTLTKARPDCLEDLIALNALFRPGPMDYIPNFINRKHGLESVDIPHPNLVPVLTNTYGIMVYQEQVMQAAQVVAGYSLGGADLLRRAMGKKKPEEMAQQREIFVAGAKKNGIDAQKANEIFDTMEKFAGYGFNKSHAAAYSVVAYQTAYLKAHHPAAFMAATLSSDMDNTDKVYFFYEDAVAQGLTILSPDINSSNFRFEPRGEKTIAYGLGGIKGTGEAAILNIIKARAAKPFGDLFDLCRRVDKRIVNRRAIEALIKGGAFDSISDHRHQLLASLDAALESAEQQARSANQNSLFGEEENALAPVPLAEVERWTLRQQLQNEKQALGFYLSGHPYQEYAAELAQFIRLKLSDITPKLASQSGNGNNGRRNGGVAVTLAGIIISQRVQQTRRGRMCFITLGDGESQIEVSVFNEEYEKSRPWIRDDELLIVKGRASFDEYSDSMRITAEELFDLASARSQFARCLQLTVSPNKRISVPRLKELLTPYRDGKCPVVICYSNIVGYAELQLGSDWGISLHNDLISGLTKSLGMKNVQINYAA